MTPETFLATHPVFSRHELGAILPRAKPPGAAGTLTAHLVRWQRLGRIAQVKRGLYVRKGPDPDFLLLASRMAGDAALAYHTALEAHGIAQSLFEKLFFVTWTKTKPVTFHGRTFTPVRPPAALRRGELSTRWIETLERSGLEVRATTLERTAADVLDRPDLAGGLEEAWRSCSAIPAFDLGELEAYVRALGSRILAAKVGFFLEGRKEALAVPEALLRRLRSLIPKAPLYMERGRPGRVLPEWNLVVPVELVTGEWAVPA